MKEPELRDLIAKDIRKLKPGLTLLQKEQYIPSRHGTKSFIDLYAKDERNRHVLIELKRSTAASRQALHEVSKYIEGVKQHFGAKDSEIVVIIASTDWSELLVPFSYFAEEVSVCVEGVEILVNECENTFRCDPKLPLPIEQGRSFAPWHNIYLYHDSNSFQKGVESIMHSYATKGVHDYIIVGFRERSIDDAAGQLSYPFIAYTATQLLSAETCMHILSADADILAYAKEILQDPDEEDLLAHLHECIEMLTPSPICDSREIGYPAKFCGIIGNEHYEIFGLYRFGKFQRNMLLTNEMVLSELCGEDGAIGQRFERTISLPDTKAVNALKKDIDHALIWNPVWDRHLQTIIDEVTIDFSKAELKVDIYSPCTGVLTMYYPLARFHGSSYIPTYYATVKAPDICRIYFGALQGNGSPMPFTQILRKYYEGSIWALLQTMLWDGRETRDSEIIEDMGLQYSSFRVDLFEQEPQFYIWKEDKWRDHGACGFLDLYQEYVEKNAAFVRQIISTIRAYVCGNTTMPGSAGNMDV